MDTLNLIGVKTLRAGEITTTDYMVTADLQTKPEKCPKCSKAELWEFGRRSIRYMDLRLHGKITIINLHRQRYRCQGCKHTFFAVSPEFDSEFRLTTRCVKWIEQEAVCKPFTHIAEHIGINEKVVRNVFRRYAHQRENELKPVAGKVMGIDELYLISQYRCILTNLGQKTVIDLLPQRKYPAVAAYLKRLEGSSKTEAVCIDMWEPYKLAVQAVMPQAAIVVDKFHVTKLANECMDRIRKQFQSTLTTGNRRDLMRSRFVLLRRSRELKDEHRDKLAQWRKSCPELADAYDQKEKFFAIYDHRTVKEAKAAYEAWVNSLPLSISKAFRPLQTAVKNWEPNIFGYFDSRFTNAYTECLNGIAKVTNRLGRGYSFDVIRFKLLFAHDHNKRKGQTLRSWLNRQGLPFSTFNESSQEFNAE